MTLVVVPLAGPDAYDVAGRPRALEATPQGTLLDAVLGQRPWAPSGADGPETRYVFVTREHATGADTLEAHLRQSFTGAQVVRLDGLTRGALLTALAGLAAMRVPDAPVVIDLADIGFVWEVDVGTVFTRHPTVDAIVPWFESQEPCYSYVRIDGDRVREAREKRVISSCASAGVYVFRNVPVLLRAIAHGLAHPEETVVGSNFFVCPIVNGVIAGGREVLATPVTEVVSHSAGRHTGKETPP